MPENCALSHGSSVLGRDPRDSPLEPSCGKSVHSHTVSAWEGGGEGGIPLGGAGVGEPRTGIIYAIFFTTLLYNSTELLP